jgi:type IV secretory pathway TraG/TraD family ATPase VirD4
MVDAVAVEGDMQWWAQKAASALAAALHCAALTGNDITAVWAWANGRGEAMIERAARMGASQELLGALRELRGTGKTAESIRITLSKALAWVAVPAMRDMVTGPEAVPFNVAAWIESRGTIYMLAPGGDDAQMIAPLFRCFASFVHRAAAAYAQTLPGRRLDPRLGFFLDELHMAPVDLPAWSSDSAAWGCEVIAVVHSDGQLLSKYQEAGTKTVVQNMTTKVILPGIHDTDTLDWAAQLCGQKRRAERDGDESGRMADWVAPSELIRTLPVKRALVVRGNLEPVAVRFRPWWTRADVRLRQLAGSRLLPPVAEPAMVRLHDEHGPGEVTAPLRLVPDDTRVAGAEPEANVEDAGDIIG